MPDKWQNNIVYRVLVNILLSQFNDHIFSVQTWLLRLVFFVILLLQFGFFRQVRFLKIISTAMFNDQIAQKNFKANFSQSFRNRLVPNIRLVRMNVNESVIARNSLESIVITIGAFAERIQNNFLYPITRFKQQHGSLWILLFERALSHQVFPVLRVPIGILGVLWEQHFANFCPIFKQTFFTDLMCMNIVSTKTLHTEVIYESVFLTRFHLW